MRSCINFVIVNNFKEMHNSSKTVPLSRENESSKLRLTAMDVNKFKIDFDSDSDSDSKKS